MEIQSNLNLQYTKIQAHFGAKTLYFLMNKQIVISVSYTKIVHLAIVLFCKKTVMNTLYIA